MLAVRDSIDDDGVDVEAKAERAHDRTVLGDWFAVNEKTGGGLR